jgi:hypothetical protein
VRTLGYHVQEWWSWDGTYAVWRDLPWGFSVLVWRGESQSRATELCIALNSSKDGDQ